MRHLRLTIGLFYLIKCLPSVLNGVAPAGIRQGSEGDVKGEGGEDELREETSMSSMLSPPTV